jgi:hypothetical protein
MLREQRVAHMFAMFKKNRGWKSISKYYNLENIKVDLVRQSQFTFDVSFIYENKCPLLTLHLPVELIRYIKDFLREQVRIEASVYYPENYPWDSPIWSIRNYKTTVQKFKSKCLCIDLYNETYSNSWTIIAVLEQDLLSFLHWLLA